MSTKQELHSVQLAIIRDLTLTNHLRFRDLNTANLPTDQFSFHLNQLIKSNLISKSATFGYELTTQGKIIADFIDTRIAKFEDQAKLTVSIIVEREKSSQKYILLQKRLKHPYYGYWGTITGKVRKGETPQETVLRELEEETGLIATEIKFKGIKHKLDYDIDSNLLADKYFFVFVVTKYDGDLIEDFAEGHNQWVKQDQVNQLPNLFEDIPVILKIISQDSIAYEENTYTVTGF